MCIAMFVTPCVFHPTRLKHQSKDIRKSESVAVVQYFDLFQAKLCGALPLAAIYRYPW
jgi:hypothetical protein